MAGENLPMVGKLLGHRRHRTTAGYAHLADGHLVKAAEEVGTIVAQAMGMLRPEPNSRVQADCQRTRQPIRVPTCMTSQ